MVPQMIFGLALGPHHITNIKYHNMKEIIETSVSDFPLRDTTDYCGMALLRKNVLSLAQLIILVLVL